ncbi:MAG: glycosyltransferase family 4 protein [Myxococcota bacterium]|nr:glycosyltransferase family 4 protein [Myxococcota bacterium]
MRVLMLNYEYPPLGGGAGNATFFLLQAFSKASDLTLDLVTASIEGTKVVPATRNATVHYLDIGKKGNLHYQTNRDLLTYSLRAYRTSKKLLEDHPYDLVHAFFGIPCGYIARHLKLPYIISLRGSDVPFYNQRFEKLDRFIFKRMSQKIWSDAARVVANSDGLKTLAQRSAPGQRIDVIPNGVDTCFFTPAQKKVSRGPISIVSTGRLIARKGYRYLIQALERLEGFELNLIGDGNLCSELQALARDIKVNVVFAGKKNRKEVRDCLQCADVFVLPSLNEGMSNAVLEAMACALPVIVTDVGGSDELIKGNGHIVEKANAAALRQALLSYRENPGHLAAHGAQSRLLAEQMSWSTVSEKYLDIYREASAGDSFC